MKQLTDFQKEMLISKYQLLVELRDNAKTKMSEDKDLADYNEGKMQAYERGRAIVGEIATWLGLDIYELATTAEMEAEAKEEQQKANYNDSVGNILFNAFSHFQNNGGIK